MNIKNITLRLRRFMLYAVIAINAAALVMACGESKAPSQADEAENTEAKAMLQGIWVDEDTDEPVFRVQGDTIYYPDSTSQPAYFRIVSDSLELGASHARYAIVKQSAHLFWFKNQAGDVLHLSKSDDEQALATDFVDDQPQVMVYTEVVKRDSVIMYHGERYHWYIAINPTKYKVVATTYNDDGVAVDNVYYDNIIHVSLFHGASQVYSRDFRKQQYEKLVPKQFLSQAVLGAMTYSHADGAGFHFSASLCKPDGATCYMVDNVISTDGQLKTTLVEH